MCSQQVLDGGTIPLCYDSFTLGIGDRISSNSVHPEVFPGAVLVLQLSRSWQLLGNIPIRQLEKGHSQPPLLCMLSLATSEAWKLGQCPSGDLFWENVH